jgi:hypothetical protein
MFCDPHMADEYYENAKKRLCLELWRLRWKWNLPSLDWWYCYKFRLDRRKEEK